MPAWVKEAVPGEKYLGKDQQGNEYTAHDVWRKKMIWKPQWKKVWKTKQVEAHKTEKKEEWVTEKVQDFKIEKVQEWVVDKVQDFEIKKVQEWKQEKKLDWKIEKKLNYKTEKKQEWKTEKVRQFLIKFNGFLIFKFYLEIGMERRMGSSMETSEETSLG